MVSAAFCATCPTDAQGEAFILMKPLGGKRYDTPDLPLVSVLTPVYNGEAHLVECIESVLEQTYGAWEYILVDNRSTDRTLEIAKSYADLDDRIRVTSNSKFLGIIENHNEAFQQISPESKYCKVVQADDWLYPQCLEKMVGLAEENQNVGLVGAYRMDGDEVGSVGLPISQAVFSGPQISKAMLLGEMPRVFGSPTTHLIRSDLIRNQKEFYNPRNLSADTEACFEVLARADLGFVYEVLTYTRRPKECNTSEAYWLGAHPVGDLWIAEKYAQYYLSQQELGSYMAAVLRRYFRVLAKGILRLKGRRFWSFHKRAKPRFSFSIGPTVVVKAALWSVWDLFCQALTMCLQSLRCLNPGQANRRKIDL